MLKRLCAHLAGPNLSNTSRGLILSLPARSLEGCSLVSQPVTQRRSIKVLNTPGQIGSSYQNTAIKRAGTDELVRHTEVYDGYTDDFGVFKEGPPTSIRLEYLRSPEHGYSQTEHSRLMWSPFQSDNSMNHYTPFYNDHLDFNSINYFGKRGGTDPGSRYKSGHYRRRLMNITDSRVMINTMPQLRVPKWLACICHFPKKKRFVGFYLYANGIYVAELLTYKQLPRLIYNKPFQSFLPTVGQTLLLSEVSYGKEIHSVELYPGHGGAICRAAGTSATVLRGSEPGVVPLLLPSKEVRLFDTSCAAVFGRVAGALYRQNRFQGSTQCNRYVPHRPRVHQQSQTITSHPQGGGKGTDENLIVSLDWRLHPRNCVKSKYWLSGYILRGRSYQRQSTVADIKSKNYSWASRSRVYK